MGTAKFSGVEINEQSVKVNHERRIMESKYSNFVAHIKREEINSRPGDLRDCAIVFAYAYKSWKDEYDKFLEMIK